LFVQAIETTKITVPVYFLCGNHDEPELFKRYFVNAPFCSETVIENAHWQILLLNSKSETPAGFVNNSALNQLNEAVDTDKSQLLFMHHHPIDVGYFIDKHGLKNKKDFWQAIDHSQGYNQKYNQKNSQNSIKGIACGHIHQGLTLEPNDTGRSTTLYTCPATSIQFDPTAETVKALPIGPGYRLFYLSTNASLTTEIKYLAHFSR
jgi:Icc protein